MRIDVYFEKPSKAGGNIHATLVAQFCDEDLYTACLPALKKIARYNGFIVTESVKEDSKLDNSNEDEVGEDGEAIAPSMFR
jgi:hypothetical protein